jgi:hypothetical protein
MARDIIWFSFASGVSIGRRSVFATFGIVYASLNLIVIDYPPDFVNIMLSLEEFKEPIGTRLTNSKEVQILKGEIHAD